MYYYGARYYDPRISIFISVDLLAEETMEPYSYVGNNPIMFTDPTGMERNMIDGPGDEFTSLVEAAKDFGNEYNGMSISYGFEITTNFYEAKNSKGESYISYTIPSVGGEGAVQMTNDLSKGETIVADGHTHGGDDRVTSFMHKGKEIWLSNANRFSDQDISLYNNDLETKNPFNQKIQGIVITPNGGVLHYDPNGTYRDINVKGIFGPTSSYNQPIDSSMPSDPASKLLKLNTRDPINMPKVLPKGFGTNFYKKRDGY